MAPITVLIFLVILELVIALRYGPVTPLKLFQTNSGNWLGFQHFLHSADIRQQTTISNLSSLIAHPSLPFDLLWNSGCVLYMHVYRLEEIVEQLRTRSQLAALHLLLSEACLEGASIHRSGNHRSSLIRAFGEGYFFAKFPAQEDRLPPAMSSHTFLEQLRLATRQGTLLQSCNWMVHAGAPLKIITNPPSKLLRDSDGWKRVHHSCYQPDNVSIFGTARAKNLLSALIADAPSTSGRDFDLNEQARWCLHLMLVLMRFVEMPADQAASSVLSYLTLVYSRLMQLAEVETESLRKFNFGILRKMVRAACVYYKEMRSIAFDPSNNEGRSDINFLNKIKIPELFNTLDLILEGVPAAQHGRWTLDLLEYTFQLWPEFWTRYKSAKELLKAHLLTASSLQQWNWIQIYMRKSKEMKFAQETIFALIKSNPAFQSRLLDPMDSDEGEFLPFVIKSAIPFKRRLKHMREQFILGDLLSFRLSTMFYSTECKSLEALVNVYFQLAMSRGILCQHEDSSPYHSIRFVDEDYLDEFLHALIISILFRIPMPVELHPQDLLVLLAFDRSPYTYYENFFGSRFDVQKKHQMLQRVHATVDRLMPTGMISWQEFMVLSYMN